MRLYEKNNVNLGNDFVKLFFTCTYTVINLFMTIYLQYI